MEAHEHNKICSHYVTNSEYSRNLRNKKKENNSYKFVNYSLNPITCISTIVIKEQNKDKINIMDENDKKRKSEQVDLPENSNQAYDTRDELVSTDTSDDDDTTSESSEDDNQAEKKKKPKRCEFPSCRTKLFLTSYSCYCGDYFCALHTPPEEHDCDFDYHAMAKKKIKKDNPKVVKEKVPEI